MHSLFSDRIMRTFLEIVKWCYPLSELHVCHGNHLTLQKPETQKQTCQPSPPWKPLDRILHSESLKWTLSNYWSRNVLTRSCIFKETIYLVVAPRTRALCRTTTNLAECNHVNITNFYKTQIMCIWGSKWWIFHEPHLSFPTNSVHTRFDFCTLWHVIFIMRNSVCS